MRPFYGWRDKYGIEIDEKHLNTVVEIAERQKASGFMEVSSISYTATNKEIGYNCHFFEMGDMYHIGLHETTIDRHPCDRMVGDI